MAKLQTFHLSSIQAMYGFFAVLHAGLATLYLYTNGITMEQLVISSTIIYASATFSMFTVKRISLHSYLTLGILFRMLVVAPFLFVPTLPLIYLSSAFFGFAITFFWVPLNVLYFEQGKKKEKAQRSALYFAILPFTDVVATFLAGVIVTRYGYQTVFLLALLFGSLTLGYVSRLKDGRMISLDIRKSLTKIKGLRTLIVLEGLGQGFAWPAIPLVTLFFITEPFEYANFFVVLGLIGVLSSFLLSSLSDRWAKRSIFLQPLSFILGIGDVMSAFASTILQWGFWRGVCSLSGVLLAPFRNTVFLDTTKNIRALYIGREFLLNIGRGLGTIGLLVFIWFGELQLALVIPGILNILFPLIVELKRIYPNEPFVFKPLRTFLRQ